MLRIIVLFKQWQTSFPQTRIYLRHIKKVKNLKNNLLISIKQ